MGKHYPKSCSPSFLLLSFQVCPNEKFFVSGLLRNFNHFFKMFLLVAALAVASASRDHTNLVGPYSALPDLDCAVRALAYDFSVHTTPWADAQNVADALRLAIDCPNNTLVPAPVPRASGVPAGSPVPSGASVFFADSVHGSDSGGSGTQASPFATISRALAAARAASPPATIVLREGTFFLPATLELTASDSGLTMSAFPGENPVVSGGVSLAGLAWQPVVLPSPSPSPQPSINGPFPGSIIDHCVNSPGASNPGVCVPLGKLPSALACKSACLASPQCTGYTYHEVGAGPSWSTWCYARQDGYAVNDGEGGHSCGWRTSAPPPADLNVWQATLPSSVGDFDQLFLAGRRLQRARWPNANAETQQFPEGFASGARYLPPHTYPPPSEVNLPGINPDSHDFPNFQWGTGGTVANFTTGSFWGTQNPPAGGQYRVPSGMDISSVPGVDPSTWSRVSGGIVHVFQGGYWGDWKFNLSAEVINGSTLMYEAGGWQEARGGGGNDWYVENIPELLDVAGEWYFNTDTRVLQIAFNGTNATGADTLVAAQLPEILRLTGSAASPVAGVTLLGLTFAHTLTDYMLPYTVPSGGDWSFHDGGQVRLSGTQGVSVVNCTFFAPGGNGLMVSGYNRATRVLDSEFAYTGASAIVSAGLGGGALDAGAPNFPEGLLIQGCVGREIGVYVKQSGFFYEGVTANFSVLGCVVFNAARAIININDDFAGGHLVQSNLMFNGVRESHDHGNLNSWNREPYAWRIGSEAVIPLPIVVTRNFIVSSNF